MAGSSCAGTILPTGPPQLHHAATLHHLAPLLFHFEALRQRVQARCIALRDGLEDMLLKGKIYKKPWRFPAKMRGSCNFSLGEMI
jgi:hypothetical protein